MRNGDFLRRFMLPQMSGRAADWDNLSGNDNQAETTVGSFEECRALCASRPDCVQFALTGRSCRTSDALRVGHEQVSVQRIYSGWMTDRVAALADEWDAECRGGAWTLP